MFVRFVHESYIKSISKWCLIDFKNTMFKNQKSSLFLLVQKSHFVYIFFQSVIWKRCAIKNQYDYLFNIFPNRKKTINNFIKYGKRPWFAQRGQSVPCLHQGVQNMKTNNWGGVPKASGSLKKRSLNKTTHTHTQNRALRLRFWWL